ncbi:MAG: LapA family protein [Pseudomonadota bacterium]|nr:LapA family protein [Pseudomonadota bacterium]
MAYLTWVIRILLFLVLLGLATRNLDPVHVHGFLGYEWKAPLALVMLVALVLGVAVGVAGTLRTAISLILRGREARGHSPLPSELPPAEASPGAGIPVYPATLRPARDLPGDDEGA